MKTSLLRSKHHLLKLFFVLFVTLPFSYHCVEKPLAFKAPTWETVLSVPLLEKTFFFGDMIAKDKAFISDSVTGMYMYVPTNSDSGFVKKIDSSVFQMPTPQGNTISQEIGVVPVTIGNSPSFSLTAAQLGINSTNFNPSFPPQTVTLRPTQLGLPINQTLLFDFPAIPIDQNFGDTLTYRYLIFQNGTMSLKIVNNFPFAIQFISNQIRLVNFNTPSDSNGATGTVAVFEFSGQINASDSATSIPALLSGVKMDGILKLKGTMKTVGATGKTLTSNDKISSTVTVLNPQIQSMVPDPAPPTTFNKVFGDSSKYKYVVFENGQIGLSIKNNFPFTIQFIGDTLQLINFNKATDSTEIVATLKFSGGQIKSGETGGATPVSLVNVKMDAFLKIKGTVKISDYFGTTITNSDSIIAIVSLANTGIKSALAITNDYDGTSVYAVADSAVKLDDSIKVTTADFTKGKMVIHLVNKIPLKITVQFKIDELINKTNGVNGASGAAYQLTGTNPVTGEVTIEPKASLTDSVMMKVVKFSSRNALKQPTGILPTRYLHFTVQIRTLKASSDYVLVNKTDFVTADIQPTEPFELQKVVGSIPPQEYAIDKTYDAKIGDINDKLTVTKITSALRLGTSVFASGGFPANLDLAITPVNKTGGTGDPIPIIERINPRIQTLITIDSAKVNTMINNFLTKYGQFPSYFNLRGKIVINPDYDLISTDAVKGVGDIDRKDSISVDLSYAIPVAIGIKDAKLIDTTSFSETFNDTASVNLIKSGKIYLDIKNTFPLDVEMNLALLKGQLGDKTKVDKLALPVLTIPQHPTDSLNYPPLHIKANTAGDTLGERSFTFLNLTPDDAKKLNEASFTAVTLKMVTAGGGNTAKEFKKTDKLVLSVKANIIFLVDQNKLK